MAITTLDGIFVGTALPPEVFVKSGAFGTTGITSGRLMSSWYLTGYPAAAAAPTPGLAGAALTAPVTGQLEIPPSSNQTYLQNMRFKNSAGAGSLVLLCDRLWHNSGFTITLTSAQTVNSVTFPARDKNQTTDGEGVLLGVEISTTTGAGTPTITVSYTNQAGTAGRIATNIPATIASLVAGGFIPIDLQAGDTGVRSVQSLTLSATWTSGVMHLVAYRLLSSMIIRPGFSADSDIVDSGLIPIFDGSVPFFLVGQSTAAQMIGSVTFTQG
jgi:hypothetical protein